MRAEKLFEVLKGGKFSLYALTQELTNKFYMLVPLLSSEEQQE